MWIWTFDAQKPQRVQGPLFDVWLALALAPLYPQRALLNCVVHRHKVYIDSYKLMCSL